MVTIAKSLFQDKSSVFLEYPSINFQQDINFLTKYLRMSDWNPQEAIEKIIYAYRLKASMSCLIMEII